MFNKKTPSIFISGIAGFVGSRLAIALSALEFNIFGVDNLITGYPENIPNLVENTHWWRLNIAHHSAENLDNLSEMMVKAKEAGNGTLIIVHCAAPAYDALSHFMGVLVTNGIETGTMMMAYASLRAKASSFVNFSSMARYERNNYFGHLAKRGYIESDPRGGMSTYGEAKSSAEAKLEIVFQTAGMPCIHVVMHNVIGVGQQYNNPIRNVVSIFMNLALHEKPIIIHGNGHQKRTFSPWKGIEPVLLELILNAEKYDRLVINVGPDPEYSMSVLEVGKLAFEIASELRGKEIPFQADYVEIENRTSLETALCNHDLMKRMFGEIAKPDYAKTLWNMGIAMLETPRDFDHGVLEHIDLGRDGLPDIYKEQTLSIRAD